MRILFHSTAPWGNSSYSVLTKRTVPEIVRLGYTDVCISTWYGLQGEPQIMRIRPRGEPKAEPLAHVRVMPTVNGAAYGTDTMPGIYMMMKADLLITCMDVWVIPAGITNQKLQPRGEPMNFAPWFPVDHAPAPAGIVEAVRSALYPMCFSKWGVDVLEKAGVVAHYVPCSADADFFTPIPRAAAREKLGIPDKCDFLASMVAANKDPSDRKSFGEALQGFARFAEKHEGAMLYVHTNWEGPVNVGHIAQRLGLVDRIIRPDALAYILGLYDEKYVQAVYSASDVLLNPAKSEGFGMPLVEAQLCGCPIAATDFSTTAELLSAGWKIPGQLNWSIGADSWRYVPFVDGIADALEAAWDDRGSETLRRQARKGALAYDTQRVAREYWLPALREIEELVSGAGKLKLVTF